MSMWENDDVSREMERRDQELMDGDGNHQYPPIDGWGYLFFLGFGAVVVGIMVLLDLLF